MFNKRSVKTGSYPALVGSIFAVMMLYLSPNLSATGYDAKLVGDNVCMSCHDDVVLAFENTGHALANVSGEIQVVSCESCHGPGSKHADAGGTDFIVNPAAIEDGSGAVNCKSCHDRIEFEFGMAHAEEGNCSDCHLVHSSNKTLLKDQGADLCFGCHADIRAAFVLPSHHPVMENLIGCNDCHQVHGGKAAFASSVEDDRDLCISCHASKQGPFAFEHDPVNEDCSICHNPHGTVADNLLIQSEPMICMSCHPLHFHTSLAGYVGDFQAPMHPERGGTSTIDGFKSAMMTKCTQCHTDIHGSDLPAQSITGSGALTR